MMVEGRGLEVEAEVVADDLMNAQQEDAETTGNGRLEEVAAVVEKKAAMVLFEQRPDSQAVEEGSSTSSRTFGRV